MRTPLLPRLLFAGCVASAGAVAVALSACDSAPPPGIVGSATPNASIQPAPLSTELPELVDGGPVYDAGARDPDAGPAPPETMLPATPLPADAPVSQKDTAPGLTLDAVFRWRDVPAPPRAPEVSTDGLREAQKVTAPTVKIDLAEAGRMRMELTGAGFPLPPHSELCARSDHYGNILVWSNGEGYRVIPPGALRPLLGERRVDVTPLSAGAVKSQGEGKRLGVTVRKVEITSSVSVTRLEIARAPEAGEGGALLCRALVELGGVDPRTPVCQPGEVPLAASYAWQEGGGIAFEVTAKAKRADLSTTALLVPPPGVAFVPAGLPGPSDGVLLPREILAAFRTGPILLPRPSDRRVPTEGLAAVNHADRLMYVLLDGIPVAAVPPFGEVLVPAPVHGRYVAEWRSFLGEIVGPPQPIEIPARLVYGGAADAGAPDGG